jgi:hypothetical protein
MQGSFIDEKQPGIKQLFGEEWNQRPIIKNDGTVLRKGVLGDERKIGKITGGEFVPVTQLNETGAAG